ncbi:hypothetical protein P4O66_020699 [Electrophorus voltai]|uniref:Uncharacterized protein n=1 Tax=Electrophorus voltai TaxID=2609070 RepID=A0AAD8YP50_9TELE|nr:hypothetical protein P4O66_020699 [Electrophorus voltai]
MSQYQYQYRYWSLKGFHDHRVKKIHPALPHLRDLTPLLPHPQSHQLLPPADLWTPLTPQDCIVTEAPGDSKWTDWRRQVSK